MARRTVVVSVGRYTGREAVMMKQILALPAGTTIAVARPRETRIVQVLGEVEVVSSVPLKKKVRHH